MVFSFLCFILFTKIEWFEIVTIKISCNSSQPVDEVFCGTTYWASTYFLIQVVCITTLSTFIDIKVQCDVREVQILSVKDNLFECCKVILYIIWNLTVRNTTCIWIFCKFGFYFKFLEDGNLLINRYVNTVCKEKFFLAFTILIKVVSYIFNILILFLKCFECSVTKVFCRLNPHSFL